MASAADTNSSTSTSNDNIRFILSIYVCISVVNVTTVLTIEITERCASRRSASVETAIADIDDSLVPEIGVTGGKVVCTGFDGDIRVYTVDGKQVANQNLGRGIYIVKASNGKQTFVKRIAL